MAAVCECGGPASWATDVSAGATGVDGRGGGLSRRTLLRSGALVLGGLEAVARARGASAASFGSASVAFGSATAAAAVDPVLSRHLARHGIAVHPRADWAAGLAEATQVPTEAAVHALVVHHSVTPNTYSADKVAGVLRGIHAFHTGPTAGGRGKGWPDIAYSFFVDRFGGVWEGRSGSLARPVEGSATGGNQGSTRLVCLLGDFTAVEPPELMHASLVRLLAALADTHAVPTQRGAMATFVSRGSNRWPRGSTVRVPTVCGHRQLSMTSCPGDGAYGLVSGALPAEVEARRHAAR